MVSTDAIVGIKIGYILAWAFIASYYFIWGANIATEGIDYTDESGWIPDGIFAHSITAGMTQDVTGAEE